MAGHGGVDRPLPRPLHDHGHRLDDDQRRRGAGDDAAGRRLDPGGRTPTTCEWRPNSGRRIVEMVWEDQRPQSFLDLRSFENAVSVVMALGGSTNAVIHLIAMARRLGIPLDLDTFDRISRSTPVIANLRPSGKYLMEDFYYAGGLQGADAEHDRPAARRLPHRQRPAARREPGRRRRLRQRRHPLARQPAVAAKAGCWCCTARLRRNGAVIKHTAADARLLQHRGRAVTFADRDDLAKRIDDPDLDVEEDDVIVLEERGTGRGAGDAGMGRAADPEEAAAEGRARHAAHLGRAHERHQLRRLRAARLARGGARRPARPRRGRRHDRDRRGGAAARPARSGGGAGAPAGRLARAAALLFPRLRGALHAACHVRRRGLRLRLPRPRRARRPSRRSTEGRRA